MNLSDTAILKIHGADFHCIIPRISKNETINVMQNMDLNENKWNIIKYKHLLSNKKMSKYILTFGDIEIEKNKFYRYKSSNF